MQKYDRRKNQTAHRYFKRRGFVGGRAVGGANARGHPTPGWAKDGWSIDVKPQKLKPQVCACDAQMLMNTSRQADTLIWPTVRFLIVRRAVAAARVRMPNPSKTQ